MKITDKMRLDWLGDRARVNQLENRVTYWELDAGDFFIGRGLRGVIDAAIRAERARRRGGRGAGA